MARKLTLVKLWLLFFLSLIFYPASAQIEEGRPVVILLTPDTTYAGSLDDSYPQYQTPALVGVFQDQKGMITNRNALEILFLNIYYNGIKVAAEEQMVILAIPAGNSRETWLHIASILFDKFHVPSLYIHEADKWDDAITPELTPGDKLYWITGQQN